MMKHIFSIVLLLMLLFAASACEDDYRDIVFFSGDKPIYDPGTCDNLLSSVTVYLTKPEGTIVGLDGGNGDYSFLNSNKSVVSVAFVKSESGYQRLLLTPKSKGGAVIEIRDGSGAAARLVVEVEECMKQVLIKQKESIYVEGEATAEQKAAIVAAMADMFPVKLGGRYVLLIGEDETWEKGVLCVYKDVSAEPIVGTYESIWEDDLERSSFRFSYDGKVHVLYRGGYDKPATKMSPIEPMNLWEDVTDICPVTVPVGCTVYHGEELYLKF